MKEAALYVHIPFCDHKCIYCDFYSITSQQNVAAFLSAIKKEIALHARSYSHGRIFTSVFFGGGTPSLMEPGYLNEILQALRENYEITEDAEITLESNPGTVSGEKLNEFCSLGFNRLSIGVQSFDDTDLKFLTRIHSSEQAKRTVDDALNAGFKNINIDLMFNLPGQTKQTWQQNLQRAVNLPVTHISAYSLILEQGTILNKMVLDGKVSIGDTDYDAEIYSLTIDFLENYSFFQYEVSNFARPGFECRHNNAYWHYRDYISFGPSAHSFADGKRWWNYSSLKKYISSVEEAGLAIAGSEVLTDSQMLEEYVMLAFRSSGLMQDEMKERFGEKWLNERMPKLKSFQNRGLLEIKDGMIRLTKKGYAVCDEIIQKLVD